MSQLHYFQRYDSRENWVTNSTLLLLSRLYHYDRLKFERILNSILDESNLSLNIGVNFTQQQWGQSSVVDGVIFQDSFKVVIETKLYDNFSTDQLQRHLDAFNAGYSQRILLALSKNKVDSNIRSEIIKTLQNEKYKDIKFASITYEDICKIISCNLADFDLEMKEILDDYILFCTENELTNIENRTLLAFTAGRSIIDNLKYRIYYDPATRNHSYPFNYIGLYVNKALVAVGRVNKTVYCDYNNGMLVSTNGYDLTKLNEEECQRIKETIENTNYYDLDSGVKFYLVDNFYETTFNTAPFRAKKYLWLDDIDGFKEGMSAKEIAILINGKSWE